MPIMNAIASLAVRDLDASLRWYATLFGREPDSRPMPEVAEWKFARGGWLQVYRLPERAGQGSLTLSVSDLEAEAARLAEIGIGGGTRAGGEKVKTLMIKDPDGNSIAFAQAIDAAMAQ